MKYIHLLIAIAFISLAARLEAQSYTMPAEDLPHEGTWLQWPQPYLYGAAYSSSLDTTWIQMTRALVQSEKVHIIAYNSTEQARITGLLSSFNISLTNVDFRLFQTDDVWVRDNGPIFVRDSAQNLIIEDWGFNGWGGKFSSTQDNAIPTEVATAISMPAVDLNSVMTIEGGAYMIDGHGVLMACRSSILSQTTNSVRNPGMSQAQAEAILAPHLGVSKFIWLNGVTGQDITDMHIDGFVQFANDSTIVTMSRSDLQYWLLPDADIDTLYAATNVSGRPYHFVYVPLTMNNVLTTADSNLGYQGSYCNYYIANTVVLVPFYNDPNDSVALRIIQGLHPGRTAIGIDVRNLYMNGGMVHCVTQQQPVAKATTGINGLSPDGGMLVGQNHPNPFAGTSTIDMMLDKEEWVEITVYNSLGQQVSTAYSGVMPAGKESISIYADTLAAGVYEYDVKINGHQPVTRRMVVMK